ncbi:DUF2268 domain-containing protein [Bacillus marasmi]|uniref:DUF2268 domain-containing protein n=1 Tax=Bacillus marasmi TaxID=1926279 RepID=UPI0011C95988|nr:DUF2268 domain-containing protein [Bacillus marasmi]
MGVIDTDKWLDEQFNHPIEVCKKLLFSDNRHKQADKRSNSLNRKETQALRNFYRYLQNFGMYRPTKLTYTTFEELKEREVWSTVEEMFVHYQQRWRGPDIPVYIFPFAGNQGLFTRSTNDRKSGVSFHDKLFLFLTPKLSKKDIEALFVHEYHHVCRLNKIEKSIKDYTLLDSIVLEGLAEVAVETNCGADYLAPWCKKYSDEQIGGFWKKYLSDHLKVKKEESLHDQLLFGERGFPYMVGYAVGYKVVKTFLDKQPLTTQETFTIRAEKMLEVMGE